MTGHMYNHASIKNRTITEDMEEERAENPGRTMTKWQQKK